MTIELYFSPQPTRSARARWAFLEAGLPVAGHAVDVFKGEQKQAAYLAVNPLGVVPTARIEGELVRESSALALVAATEGQGELLPAVGSPAYRQAIQWVVFAPAELDHLLVVLNAHRLFRPPAERDASVVEDYVARFDARAALLVSTLGEGEYLVDDRFGVADICVGHSIVWAKMHDLLTKHPVLEAYLARLEERPSFQEVYGGPIQVFPDPHAA
ncbi:MAG: glutathione S-transferase family protein [Myxococcota bacterium]